MDSVNGFSDFAEIVVDTRTLEGMRAALRIDTVPVLLQNALTIANLRVEADEWRRNGHLSEADQMDAITDELEHLFERMTPKVFTSPAGTV